jgi:hypothetical protein
MCHELTAGSEEALVLWQQLEGALASLNPLARDGEMQLLRE